MPSSIAIYRPRDAVVDTSLVLFGANNSSSSKRNRSFDYEMDPASSLVSPTSVARGTSNTALIVYDANRSFPEPMTKADPIYQRMKKQRKRRKSSRWWKSRGWPMRCQKLNFASFRNMSRRITLHEPSYIIIKRSDTEVGMVVAFHLHGPSCVGVEVAYG